MAASPSRSNTAVTAVTAIPSFRPDGCDSSRKRVPAITGTLTTNDCFSGTKR
jgi:hypothetical protein